MEQLDPKVIIARTNAEEALKKKIKEHEQSITRLVKHRGAFTAMLKNGEMIAGDVVIGTFTRIAYRPNGGLSNQFLMTDDIAEFELL